MSMSHAAGLGPVSRQSGSIENFNEWLPLFMARQPSIGVPQDGVCAGLSVLGLFALLARDQATFETRLRLIYDLYLTTDQAVDFTQPAYQEVKTFLESIKKIQEPYHFRSVFGGGRDAWKMTHRIGTMFHHLELEKKQSQIVLASEWLGSYLKRDLNDLLAMFSKLFLKIQETKQSNDPIVLLIRNYKHVICVGYDPNKVKQWTVIDTKGIQGFDSVDLATDKIHDAFLNSARHVLYVMCYSTSVLAPTLSKMFRVFEGQRSMQDDIKLRYPSGEEKIIKKYAAVDAWGTTPLILACKEGTVTLVDTLLKHGADPNQTRQEDGMSSLYLATVRGQVEMVRLLLQANAERHYHYPVTKESAIDVARKLGFRDIEEMLVGMAISPTM